MQKTKNVGRRFMQKVTFLSIISVVLFAIWLGYSGKSPVDEVLESFGSFVGLHGDDEYVIASLETNEVFNIEKYNSLMGFPIGDTNANLSLEVTYKYYVKLSELKHTLENGVFSINAPKLYLSTPVSIKFSTVRENSHAFLFGPSGKDLLNQLKNEVDEKLVLKGKSQIGVVYDKAAKALADNFNGYFLTNGYGRYYKNIVVSFSSEGSQSRRQFIYNASSE